MENWVLQVPLCAKKKHRINREKGDTEATDFDMESGFCS